MKLKKIIAESIKNIHRSVLCKKELYEINMFIYKLALHGIGVLNYESDKISGEKVFLEKIFAGMESPTIVDVGANIGEYSEKICLNSSNPTIYALEPHPGNFQKLEENIEGRNITTIRKACGDVEKKVNLFDYEEGRSSHASTVEGVVSKIHKKEKQKVKVDMTTLDRLIKKRNIYTIDLLKVDTEGNEIEVLRGAKKAIERNVIRCIQIEFNEMNVESRTFAKDFVEYLKRYNVFRMLPNGLVELGEYRPVEYEIFAFQNIVAIHKNEKDMVESLM
jgi:FkbM family methyltransferase